MQTIKSNIELPPISKGIRWRVSSTLCAPSQNPKMKDYVAYTSSEYNSIKYHRFNPRVYLIIEPFDKDQQDSSYFDKCLYMDAKDTFRFKELLRGFLKGFQTPSLFYYDNGALKLDATIAKKYQASTPIYNKMVSITYGVVRDPENASEEYEGIVIYVNNYNYMISLTAFEVGFIVDTLDHINLIDIGFQLIDSALRHKT